MSQRLNAVKDKTTKNHERVKSSSNKKWFDKECRFKRHELRKLASQKHRDPYNNNDFINVSSKNLAEGIPHC